MCTKSGKVISFINMKGGVAKTTLCLGIGEYLAHQEKHNKKILYIDMDPQFNTTQSLMDEYNLGEVYLSEFYKTKNVRKIFETPNTIAEKPILPQPEEVIVELDENIDIIPGTINLIFEDTNRDGGKVRRLKKFIKDNKLTEKYDFIFIDCPPTISLYTDSALIASDYYLVPNRIDRYSILGIKLLKQVIDRLESDNDLDIKPLGIIYTMVGDESRKTTLLKDAFEDDEIVNKIGLFNGKTTWVRDLLVGLQGNIASKYKKSREDIEIICDEFLERIG
ncbi:AAA family ATPase [Clostridium sp. C2-6-12]|uniref:ParA family protein n=1 Tax=Clostridium sp. C2-6-12 TaxID=2698832 RepID=UPI00136849C5|nr:AAA family ATPase [Clostridium sp. C2-6-12]